MGTRTPVLAGDGSDLAAAVATIQEIGRADALAEAISRAFDGSTVGVDVDAGRFTVWLRQPGMLRPMRADELSDGTLRFLLLAAALLSPRPPALFVLNEPETSLHPDLLVAVGADDQDGGREHPDHRRHPRDPLADALGDGVARIELAKELGETQVVDQGLLTRPSWTWPKR